MLSKSSWFYAEISLLTVGVSIGAIAPFLPSVSAAPNIQFPDTQNHWAQPFIGTLAERGIVTGYPDGTYRPEQPVGRDEFAAVLRQAFNQAPERRIASGSVYKDVPSNYWAAPAIEEAYEMGFMSGYPGGFFRPNQSVSRVEALVSLTQNLNLDTSTPGTQQDAATQTTAPATEKPAASATPQSTTRQSNPRRLAKKQFLYPMAMTALMQPLMSLPARARNIAAPVPSPTAQNQPAAERPAASNAAAPPPVSVTVSNFYTDAEKIPQYAVDAVAKSTRAGIVVNHPDPKILNPTRPATRGEVAAFIHQALVNQGRLAPLDRSVAASNYIVGTAQK
jgi:hypothetical protein